MSSGYWKYCFNNSYFALNNFNDEVAVDFA